MKTSLLLYRKYLFMYGLLTTLYVLRYFEEIENYEECQKIISAIKEQEERLDCKIPTVIDKECMKEVIKSYKAFGYTGENAEHNSRYYSELVIKEIYSL